MPGGRARHRTPAAPVGAGWSRTDPRRRPAVAARSSRSTRSGSAGPRASAPADRAHLRPGACEPLGAGGAARRRRSSLLVQGRDTGDGRAQPLPLGRQAIIGPRVEAPGVEALLHRLVALVADVAG